MHLTVLDVGMVRRQIRMRSISTSRLNVVEGFFAKLSQRRLRRGVFGSLVEVQAAIKRFIAETNTNPKPFVWTADPDRIIQAARRRHQVLDSAH